MLHQLGDYDGYLTLPGSILIHWGKTTPSGSSPTTFTVSGLKFGATPFWAFNVVEYDDVGAGYFIGYINGKGYMNSSRIKFCGYGGVVNRWIAFGQA